MNRSTQDLNIRRARDSDLPEMARIHFTAYPGFPMTLEERINHFKDDPRLPLEDNWICEKDGRMVALFALYNFRMYRDGDTIPVGGIGRVAVAPEARLKGVAYKAMERAVQIMEQNGVPLSILYPFRHSFYHKLGWGLVEQVRFYRIPPVAIPAYKDRSDVLPAVTSDDIDAIMSCYHKFASKRNGLLLRDEPVWYEHTLKNNLAFICRSAESNAVEGYLLYRYDPHPAEKSFMTSDIILREMIWLNDSALKRLLGFLSAQRDQIGAIEYHDHFTIPFEHILIDPLKMGGRQNMTLGAETAHIGSGLMGRIIQLRRILAQSKFGDGEGRLIFMVTDELHQANTEPLTVEFVNGRTEFTRQKGGEMTLKINIATLSSVFWGKLNIAEALDLGLAEIEGKGNTRFIESVLSFPRSVCLDHF